MREADQIFGNQSLRAYRGIVLAILKRAGLRHFRHQHYECGICEGILELNSRVHVRRKANMPFPHTKKRPRTVFLAAINLERVTGIEPASSAWKAEVLPMNYTRKMVGMTGFEPATSCSQSRRATKLRHIPNATINYYTRTNRLGVASFLILAKHFHDGISHFSGSG